MALYAAYGSNLDPRRWRERAPHSPLRGTGWLIGWRLTFGGEELGWDGALATVVEDPFGQVFVALYDVTPEDERTSTLGGRRARAVPQDRVRVHTLDGDVRPGCTCSTPTRAGCRRARTSACSADAAEAAGAPADYVPGHPHPALPVRHLRTAPHLPTR